VVRAWLEEELATAEAHARWRDAERPACDGGKLGPASQVRLMGVPGPAANAASAMETQDAFAGAQISGGPIDEN